MSDEPYQEPALTWLSHSRYDDPRYNPIAFLPTDPSGQVTYDEFVDYAWPHGRHAVIPSWSVMSDDPVQEDLSGLDRDYEVATTEKLGPDDEDLPQPTQDQQWVPLTVEEQP